MPNELADKHLLRGAAATDATLLRPQLAALARASGNAELAAIIEKTSIKVRS